MFRTTEFYDNFIKHLFSPWWMYLIIGLNLVLLAILIFIFPDALAYLVAGFLLLNGVLFIGIGLRLSRLKPRYRKWKNHYWIDIE